MIIRNMGALGENETKDDLTKHIKNIAVLAGLEDGVIATVRRVPVQSFKNNDRKSKSEQNGT
jgi:hypothetical protein